MARQFKPGQLQTGSLYNISASYAVTASYAMNGGGGGGGTTTPGGSNTQIQYNNNNTFSGVDKLTYDGTTLRATGSFTGSFTGSVFGTSSWATNSVTSSYVLNATSASFATSASRSTTSSYAQTASYVLNAISSSFSISASHAATASYYQETDPIFTAQSSSLATTGSNTFNGNQIINGNLTLNGTASISYLTVTYETASVIYSSGSNQFGDAVNDTQTLIGRTIVSGSLEVTGSLNAPNITGSLYGTASWAENALTTSYAPNALVTASISSNTITFTKGDGNTFPITVNTGSGGGVTQLLAGSNITLSPINGLGQVTISSTGGGGFNTATGSYGSFYDTTIQTNPVANIPRSMSFNSTDITNGVSISGSTSPFNTYIKTTNAGVYNIQFSAQIDKTDSGADEIVIWLRKNGIDLTDTATTLTLSGNNDKQVAAWNWFVTSAAGDYYQIIWLSADTDLRLLAESISGTHPGIPSVILTANRVDQFLSNTGSFSGSFTGTLIGTSSWTTNALTSSFVTASNVFGPFGSNSVISSSYAITASYALNGGGGGGAGTPGGSNTQIQYNNNNTFGGVDKLIFDGTNLAGTGSFSGSFSGSFFGTASYIGTLSNITTASYVETANLARTASLVLTASFVSRSISASFVETASRVITSSFVTYADFVVTASRITSASFVATASRVVTASFVESASFVATASYVNFLSENNTVATASRVISASFVATASRVISASFVETASRVITSSFVTYADFVVTASRVVSASFVDTASRIISASFVETASYVQYAATASFVENARLASTGSSLFSFIPGYYELSVSSNVSTESIVAIGQNAGVSAKFAAKSIFIGQDAGGGATSGSDSIYIGNSSGYTSVNSDQSVNIGYAAGGFVKTSSLSVSIGYEAGYNGNLDPNSDTTNGTFIGYNAGYNAINLRGSTFIGNAAGQNAKLANNSTFIGSSAGYGQPSASLSTFIGPNAGRNADILSSGFLLGQGNIIIGNNITLPSGSTRSMNIGSVIFARNLYLGISGNTLLETISGSVNALVGINQPDPTYGLDVSGSGNYTNGLTVTGSLLASSITGSLSGTASFATTASYVSNAISSSYALTASYAMNGGGSGAGFPYVGDAVITGSLLVSGSGITGSLFGTASFADIAQTAITTLTASYLNTLNQNLTFNGNLTLNGTASFTYLNTTYETASVIYSSGSNQFGDAVNDTQTLIGTVIVSGSQNVTGSLNAPNITGSLYGTASWANNALVAATASAVTIGKNTDADATYYVLFATASTLDSVTTLEYMDSGSDALSYNPKFNTLTVATVVGNLTGTATSASYVLNAVSASRAVTSSFALTASFITASNVFGPSGTSSVLTASFAISSSRAVTSSFATSASFASTASFITASRVVGTVTSASYALTASYALNGGGGGGTPGGSTNNIQYNDAGVFRGDSNFNTNGSGSVIITGSLTTSGSVIITGSLIVTGALDTTNRQLIDSTAVASFEWEAPSLNYSIKTPYFFRKTIALTTQESFTINKPNWDGEVIEVASVNGSVAQFNLVALENDGTWYAVDQTTQLATRMLGIYLDSNLVLLEGNILQDDNGTNGPIISNVDHGLVVYIKNGTTSGEMDTNIPGGNYIRRLGHCYYQSTESGAIWIFKFRPSNDWT
jgi:hypothetical protein